METIRHLPAGVVPFPTSNGLRPVVSQRRDNVAGALGHERERAHSGRALLILFFSRLPADVNSRR